VTPRTSNNGIPTRTDIERALDELVLYEGGFRFQHLAVILAKQRWPELIASEPKKDHGLDAHALTGLGLATSITPSLDKIKNDISRARGSFPKLQSLIFYTPKPVTNDMALKWAEEIQKEFGLELTVVPRADVVTSLMDPPNAPLCASHLGLPVPVPEAARETRDDVLAACRETITNWLHQYRLDERRLIKLDLARVDAHPDQILLDHDQITEELHRGGRLLLDGPPGAGKTTTLLQLARRLVDADRLCLVVDLPSWIESGQDLFTFQARDPALRSRGISATDLDTLGAAQPLVFLLNGWNEVGETHATKATRQLRELDRHYRHTGILLATRPHVLAPPLPGSWHVTVQPLRGAQRRAYITQILSERAAELSLDALTRTPLILSEVVKLFESGTPIPDAKLDILRAMSFRIETSDEHQAALSCPPVSGLGAAYLEALAVEMTKKGTVDLAEDRARAVVAATSSALRNAGQLSTAPEPQSVLTALAAHHILQRLGDPAPAYRFQHQQFQEFYAACHLHGVLGSLAASSDDAEAAEFQAAFLNRPAWHEPLVMVAEAVGTGSTAIAPSSDALAIGEQVVRLSIPVDPLLAAALARHAVGEVWARVGADLGAHLRRWYDCGDHSHRHCALAAMLETGSADFADIVLPLLTDSDAQVRLRTYRTIERFQPSSLGADWSEVIAGWDAAQRATFTGEVLARPVYAAAAEEIATSDPSPEVRLAAIHALHWVGAHDALARVLDLLDGPTLIDATSRCVETEDLSAAAKERLIDALRTRAQDERDPERRLHLLHRLLELGDPNAPDGLRSDLSNLSEADLRAINNWNLLGIVKSLRALDAQWTDTWITERLASGLLWHDRWLSYVDEVPTMLMERVIEHADTEEMDHSRLRAACDLLFHTATTEIARRIWRQLIQLRPPTPTEAEGRHDELRSALRHQLEDLTRALPASLRISAALSVISTPPGPDQARAIIEIFSRAAENEDLRADLRPELARALREALVALLPFALSEEDFGGGLKANLALAISRVGLAEDVAHIRQLIDADIIRVTRGMEAIRRREHNPQTNGARTRWSNWYVKALCWLSPEAAEPHLLDLLQEPEYEADAARALAGLVIQVRPLQARHRNPTFAPGGDPPAVLDEARHARYARAVRDRVEALMSPPGGDPPPAGRVKGLACVLSWLDGRDSRDLVLQAMALPGQWDGWSRTEASEQLLRVHPRLPADATFTVLNPTIEHLLQQGLYHQQNDYAFTRCLAILALVDDPARGVARIREALSTAHLQGYRFRDLVVPLAHNGSEEALDLLIEVANSAGGGFRSFEREWIAAVGTMTIPRARPVLMACVDPRIDPVVPALAAHYAEVAEQLAQLARSDPAVLIQIREACSLDLTPAHRRTLAQVVAHLADEDSVLSALDLIHDEATPSVPSELIRAIESVILGRELFERSASAYTIVPRGGAAVRRRLLRMAHEDPSRRHAALALLGQIEVWRIEHGRPLDEPCHPEIESRLPWPPLDLFDRNEVSGE
jgi:DNA polymerase III delta prime subunit